VCADCSPLRGLSFSPSFDLSVWSVLPSCPLAMPVPSVLSSHTLSSWTCYPALLISPPAVFFLIFSPPKTLVVITRISPPLLLFLLSPSWPSSHTHPLRAFPAPRFLPPCAHPLRMCQLIFLPTLPGLCFPLMSVPVEKFPGLIPSGTPLQPQAAPTPRHQAGTF